MTVRNGNAETLRRDLGRDGVHDAALFDLSPDFEGFAFGFFLFSADIGDDVVDDLGHSVECFSRAADRLVSADRRAFHAVFHERMQRGDVALQGAVAFDGDKAAFGTEPFFLRVDDGGVFGVDLGNDHGNVGRAPVRRVVGNDGDFRFGVFFFQGADLLFFHVDGTEDEIDEFRDLFEVCFGVENDHVLELFGNGGCHCPAFANGVLIAFSRRRGGSREGDDVEPGVIFEEQAETLSDHARCADDGDVVLFHCMCIS